MPATKDNKSRPHAGALPFKEALRTLRFLIHRSRSLAGSAVPERLLPAPIGDLARSVMGEVDQIATGVEGAADNLFHQIVGGEALSDDTLAEIFAKRDAGLYFAEAAYRGLRRAVALLAADEALISEAAARAAFDAMIATGASEAAPMLSEQYAAALIGEMARATVIREVVMAPGARIEAADCPLVAYFALMLWLLSPRIVDEAEEVLAAAVAISIGLCDEIIAASGEREQLGALIAEFRHHV